MYFTYFITLLYLEVSCKTCSDGNTPNSFTISRNSLHLSAEEQLLTSSILSYKTHLNTPCRYQPPLPNRFSLHSKSRTVDYLSPLQHYYWQIAMTVESLISSTCRLGEVFPCPIKKAKPEIKEEKDDLDWKYGFL